MKIHGLCCYLCSLGPGRPAPVQDASGKWQDLGTPADDVRLAPSSPHAGIGLLDTL